MKRRSFLQSTLLGVSSIVGPHLPLTMAARDVPGPGPQKKSLEKSGLLIGVASIDITPPVGAVMVGYMAREATGIGHSLRAEALVCQGAGGAWVLITSDTIGYTRALSLEIREAIAKSTGIPVDAVILSATHTHSGPSTIVFGRGENLRELDRNYHAVLRAKLSELARQALDNAVPGHFETAWTAAPDFGHNRRVQLANGSWGNEWQDPDGRHPGFYDPAILVVGVRRPDGRREALLVNYGCHPVVLGPKSRDLSGDYVGYMKEYLEREADVTIAMFALAGCGNINPRVCIHAGSEFPRSAGESLGRIVLDALPRLKPVAPGLVVSHCEKWSFKRTREVLKRKAAGDEQQIGEIIQTDFVAARAGDLGLISIPGEAFSEFNARLRQSSPTRDTLIVTLANDYIGYLPTDRAQQEGAYETSMAPAEKLEEPLMEGVRNAFTRIAAPSANVNSRGRA